MKIIMNPKNNSTPVLHLISGINGSGKTTFSKKYFPEFINCTNFLNADLISAGFSPFNPERYNIKSGKKIFEQIKQLSSKKERFALETTLSGRTYINTIKDLKSNGYEIYLYFIWIEKIDLILNRINERKIKGGHYINENILNRRFYKSFLNFENLYKNLSDYWVILDGNSYNEIICRSINDKFEIIDNQKYKEINLWKSLIPQN